MTTRTAPDRYCYVLVAINHSGRADRAQLLARLGTAALDIVDHDTVLGDRACATLRVTVDGSWDGLRNTVAHGYGCAAGYICHIEEVRS